MTGCTPGLFVEARIEGVSSERVLAVPNDAVLRSPDGDWQVFIEHEPGEFEPHEVEMVRTTAGYTRDRGCRTRHTGCYPGRILFASRSSPSRALTSTTTEAAPC